MVRREAIADRSSTEVRMTESTGGPAESVAADPAEPTVPSVASLAGTAVDLTLGLIAVSAAGLRAAPELAAKLPVRAAEVALVASERAQTEIDQLLVRGAHLLSQLMGLVAGRLLGPPVAPEEPAEVDPFDLLFDDAVDEDSDDVDLAEDRPRVVPFVVVTATTTAPTEIAEPAEPAEPGMDGADLPLDGFDEMTLGKLRAKARSLGIAELETLLEHERSQGARPGVLSLLETRIAQLQQEQSAG
jgi:hypothetical protein